MKNLIIKILLILMCLCCVVCITYKLTTMNNEQQSVIVNTTDGPEMQKIMNEIQKDNMTRINKDAKD